MTKTPWKITALACALLSPIPLAHAGKVETDFNDMNLGDTRTSGSGATSNLNNLDSGSGFATGGAGNYDNGTGVLQFEAGDLSAPAGVANFLSEQEPPTDPAAAGQGVVFTSGNNPDLPNHNRLQERKFASALTGSETWFSFLFRLKGPSSQGQVYFNAPASTASEGTPGVFAISMGHPSKPGAVAINLDPLQTPADLTDGDPLLYFDGTKGVEVTDSTAVTAHVILGRILQNPSGADTIEIWLDPADASDPTATAPTLTATSDAISTEGLFSVALEGTRYPVPSLTGATYTDGGHFALDHFRISDDADALDYVTGNLQIDPKLVIDTTDPSDSTSLNFRGVYGSTLPVSAAPRTITLTNAGASNPITINNILFEGTTSTFTLTPEEAFPVTLDPGDSTSFTVGASSSTIGVTQTATLVVTTDVVEQDMTFPVSAIFFNAGTRLTANPGFESNTDGWISDHFSSVTPPVRVVPGAMGSVGMVRMKGVGDPAANSAPDNFSQTLYNGASDWEMVFYFSPLDASVFHEYNTEGNPAAPDDRTFQVVIQSDSASPTSASGTEGTITDARNADAALINLAYLPEGDKGFCVFNGSSWQPIGLPLLTGSIDANKDGSLRPADSDSINFYLVRIKGTGFGTSAAKYSVSVSNPNSVTTAGTAADLTTWSSDAGTGHTPGSFTFPTGDISRSGGATLSYWIDEVSFYATEAPATDFSVAPTEEIVSHNSSVATEMIAVTNTGFTQDLVITGADFNSPAVETPQEFPLTIAPGTTQLLPIIVHGNFVNGNNAGRPVITVKSDLPVNPNRTVTFTGIGTTDQNLAGNWNFQVGGRDTGTDWDSWAGWAETGTVNASKDVAGLLDGTDTGGSGKGAYLGPNSVIRSNLGASISDYVIEFPFAVKESVTGQRMFNLAIQAANNSQINIRLKDGIWEAYHDASSTSSGWNEIITGNPVVGSVDANADNDLADSEDTKNIYKIRFTGHGWGSETPTYQFEILDTDDQVLAASDPALAFYQYGVPTAGATSITFQATQDNCPGYWVDDVSARSLVTASADLKITGISGGSGSFTIQWDSQGAPVIVERSTTLLPDSWEPISANDADGTHTDSGAPAGRAFYRLRRVTPP